MDKVDTIEIVLAALTSELDRDESIQRVRILSLDKICVVGPPDLLSCIVAIILHGSNGIRTCRLIITLEFTLIVTTKIKNKQKVEPPQKVQASQRLELSS